MREVIAAIATLLQAAAANENISDEVLIALGQALCAVINTPTPGGARPRRAPTQA